MTHLRLENRHTGEVLELRRQNQNGESILELRARCTGAPEIAGEDA